MAAVKLEEVRRAQRAEGLATVLAIGTAVPANCVYQATNPDYYFRVTKSEHLPDLKEKFERMCEKSTIRKRHMHLTEEILKKNPSICSHMEPSLNTRHDIVVVEVPKLGKEAAERAIKEWGQPLSKITHVIFCTTSGVDMPGADYQLTRLLGLSPTVKRLMMYQQGCFGGATVLRMAKDIAENNRGARVLVACVELTITAFRGPDEADSFDTLIPQGLFGDGAGAVIVGAEPYVHERPLFEMVSASQNMIPDTEHMLTMQLSSGGIGGTIATGLPRLAAGIVEQCLLDAFGDRLAGSGGVVEWNNLFWAVHPGSSAMLDHIVRALRLAPGKLAASRTVVREYGNMLGATVIFVLDEVRRQREDPEGEGAGHDEGWGVMMGFGPGFTVEAMLLHAAT